MQRRAVHGEEVGPEVERYADTAAIAYAARRDLAEVAAPGPGLVPPEGVALFFAPNATRCLAAIVEFMVRHRGFGLAPLPPGAVHPVVERSLAPLASLLGHRALRVWTAMDWITGEYRGVAARTAGDGALRVVDAVQCFGNLAPDELEEAWRTVREGAVVVGCVHKWIGSAVPVGFAALPAGLPGEDRELAAWLAARDYLGDAVDARPEFEFFTDTYSRALAPLVLPPLRLAFGNAADALAARVSTIAANRATMVELLARSVFAPAVQPPSGDCRGMVALRGGRAHLALLSGRLQRDGFVHTAMHDDGEVTLRLSAPTVPMSPGTWDAFEAALRCA